MIQEVMKNKLYLCMATIFFFLVFSINIMGALSADLFIENDKFSENFVRHQVRCEGGLYQNQLLGLKDHQGNQEPQCTEDNYLPYNSQFGLQGKFGVFLGGVLHTSSGVTVGIYQLLAALLSATLFALLTLWVKVRFGKTVAITFAILVSMSPMLVGFSRNLYWSLPLMIAPIVYILFFYQPTLSKKALALFLGGLVGLLYLRYLCGYEYITTLTVMLLSVAICQFGNARIKAGVILKQGILMGVVSVVALALAFTTHVVSLNQQTGSTEKSITIIKDRAQERTLNSAYYTKYAYMSLEYVANDFYKISSIYIKYDKLRDSGSIPLAVTTAYAAHLLLPVVHTPFLNGVLASYLQSFLVFLLVLGLLYVYRNRWTSGERRKQVMNLYLALMVGLLGYFSWLIFAYSHSLVHAHINGILMYLPTALFGFIIIGLYIEFLLKKYIPRRK